MLQRILFGIGCLAIAIAVPAFASKADVPATPDDGIVMSHSGKKEVTFNHSTHATVECADCHHPVEGKVDYRPCATAGCHAIDRKDATETLSYNHALHKPQGTKFNTCMSCHREIAGTDAELRRELTGCAKSKCHP